jgi:hypothetical protein
MMGASNAVKPAPNTIDPMMLSQLGHRMRLADEDWATSKARQENGTAQAKSQMTLQLGNAARQAAAQSANARRATGARGLAFSPIGLGRALSEIRDGRLVQKSNAKTSFARTAAELQESTNEAKRRRDAEHAFVAEQKALASMGQTSALQRVMGALR